MELPEELKEERDELVAKVYEVFDGVTREGGISWSQGAIYDELYDSVEAFEEACRVAGELDKDKNWQELADSNNFDGRGESWFYLDSIGFRYYLPATMVNCLIREKECRIAFCLTLPENSLRHYVMDMWSLFDERQKDCIVKFLIFMSKWNKKLYPNRYRDEWKEAYDSYWHKFLD